MGEIMSEDSSELVSIVRARLDVCDDEELRICGYELCDIFEEMHKSLANIDVMLNVLMEQTNKEI